MTATATRPNQYPGTCTACGGHVAPGEGHLVAKVNGRWTVGHNPCPGLVEPVAVSTYRYFGMTWAEVAEANEWWDGEPEPEAACRRRWEAESGMFCARHGDHHSAGPCWECEVEAREAVADYEDGMISTRKHGGQRRRYRRSRDFNGY